MKVAELKKRLEGIDDEAEVVFFNPMEHPIKENEIFCEYKHVIEAKVDHMEPIYFFNTIVGYSELKGFVDPKEERSKVFKIR